MFASEVKYLSLPSSISLASSPRSLLAANITCALYTPISGTPESFDSEGLISSRIKSKFCIKSANCSGNSLICHVLFITPRAEMNHLTLELMEKSLGPVFMTSPITPSPYLVESPSSPVIRSTMKRLSLSKTSVF